MTDTDQTHQQSAGTISGKPIQIPINIGRLFSTPRFAPDDMIITLLGPGLIEVDKANKTMGENGSISLH